MWILKWVGLLACLLIVLTWAASLGWSWQYGRTASPPKQYNFGICVYDQFVLWLGHGCVGYWYYPWAPYPGSVESHVRRCLTQPTWTPESTCAQAFVLPLWMPLLLLAMPTGLLWWVDRKPRAARLWGLKISAASGYVIILAVWFLSLAYKLEIGGGCDYYWTLHDGQVTLWDVYDPYDIGDRLSFEIELLQPETYGFTGPKGAYKLGIGDDQVCTFPLWLPLLPLLVLTVFAFVLGRRPPPGYCRRCGYDLTGNMSGICPECGTPAAARRTEGLRSEPLP